MRTLFILLLAVSVLAAPAAPAQASEETATFRSGVSYVRVDVQVTNGKDLVTDLTKDDFVIFDNGEPQAITYFGRDSEPVKLLLLLDVSGSMRKYIEQMAATAKQALRYLRVGDRVAVILFGKGTKLSLDFTGDLVEVAEDIQDAVHEEELVGGTELNASILDAVQRFKKVHDANGGTSAADPNDRHAILVVTDNVGLNYQSPDEAVIRSLYNADTVLNAIVVGKGRRPPEDRPGKTYNPDFTHNNVFRIAEETGGETVTAEQAGRAFNEMVERIRTRYSLHYRPPGAKAGTFRRIRVDLTPEARMRYPQGKVRHRSGYYASEP